MTLCKDIKEAIEDSLDSITDPLEKSARQLLSAITTASEANSEMDISEIISSCLSSCSISGFNPVIVDEDIVIFKHAVKTHLLVSVAVLFTDVDNDGEVDESEVRVYVDVFYSPEDFPSASHGKMYRISTRQDSVDMSRKIEYASRALAAGIENYDLLCASIS